MTKPQFAKAPCCCHWPKTGPFPFFSFSNCIVDLKDTTYQPIMYRGTSITVFHISGGDDRFSVSSACLVRVVLSIVFIQIKTKKMKVIIDVTTTGYSDFRNCQMDRQRNDSRLCGFLEPECRRRRRRPYESWQTSLRTGFRNFWLPLSLVPYRRHG